MQHWLKHADQLHKRLPEMAGQTGRICATCRGSCCLGGSDAAFLSSTMIKAQMSALTREEADKVIHNYLSRLPPQSISESCVYHTDTGCHLPSTLRSVVCNGYLCDALEHYQNQCDAEARIRPVLVISHKVHSIPESWKQITCGGRWPCLFLQLLRPPNQSLIPIRKQPNKSAQNRKPVYNSDSWNTDFSIKTKNMELIQTLGNSSLIVSLTTQAQRRALCVVFCHPAGRQNRASRNQQRPALWTSWGWQVNRTHGEQQQKARCVRQ